MRVNGVRYVEMAEVLEELEISRQTLWRWRQDCKVPYGNRFRDGRLIFTEEEVDAIRAFANSVDPAPRADDSQLALFGRQAASGPAD